MSEKSFSQICKEAKEEVENQDPSDVWQPERENAYKHDDGEVGEENKAAINRIVNND